VVLPSCTSCVHSESHLLLRCRAGAAHAPVGDLVGVAQSAGDTRGPSLAVGHIAIEADKINNGVTNGKAVVVLQNGKTTTCGRSGRSATCRMLPVVSDKATAGAGDVKDDGNSVPRPDRDSTRRHCI
jgi:hypothetical protein